MLFVSLNILSNTFEKPCIEHFQINFFFLLVKLKSIFELLCRDRFVIVLYVCESDPNKEVCL